MDQQKRGTQYFDKVQPSSNPLKRKGDEIGSSLIQKLKPTRTPLVVAPVTNATPASAPATAPATARASRTTATTTKGISSGQDIHNDARTRFLPAKPQDGHPSSSFTPHLSLGYQSKVHVACTKDTYELVAIRQCNWQHLTTERYRLMACKHRHIVPMLAWYKHNEMTYIIQEYMSVPLTAIMSCPFKLEEHHIQVVCFSVSMFNGFWLGQTPAEHEVSQAITFIFEKGLVHGAVGPHTVLLSADSIVKLREAPVL
ncbi:MAG: hypothetical protein M1823_003812 [Watsoniomyces obsoletus]|nr:MAG: hypothetical protein M1823_003812 [Watsoniomyces obsoletus]